MRSNNDSDDDSNCDDRASSVEEEEGSLNNNNNMETLTEEAQHVFDDALDDFNGSSDEVDVSFRL